MPLVLAHWEIRTGHGSAVVRGELRAPRGPAPSSAVILCHGFKGFKDWGFFPPLARALAGRGHAVISFNQSHNGVGAGEQDITDLENFSENTHSRALADIRTVIDAACSGGLFPKKPSRIGLFGHSRGGGEAIVTAADDDRVNALVTWAAVSTFDRWQKEEVEAWTRGETVHVENKRTGQQLPVRPGYWEDLVRNARALDVAAAARRLEIPWLIAHGEADETVPADSAFTLLEAGGVQAELLLVPQAGHTFGATHPFTGPTPELKTVSAATLDWFEHHLRQGG
jgi:uncharacterized protein